MLEPMRWEVALRDQVPLKQSVGSPSPHMHWDIQPSGPLWNDNNNQSLPSLGLLAIGFTNLPIPQFSLIWFVLMFPTTFRSGQWHITPFAIKFGLRGIQVSSWIVHDGFLVKVIVTLNSLDRGLVHLSYYNISDIQNKYLP